VKDLIIPEEILHATRMSEGELRQEIAILLFQKEKLTLGQASRFAGMSHLQFQHLLASREIPIHYDVAEFEEDLETLKGGWGGFNNLAAINRLDLLRQL
jgi:predicted HTH domain antitoxin